MIMEFSPTRRAYSSDASLYQLAPLAEVWIPNSAKTNKGIYDCHKYTFWAGFVFKVTIYENAGAAIVREFYPHELIKEFESVQIVDHE